MRAISHSEVDALLSCEARHAFAYTGALTSGATLSPRSTAPILRDGRAWGAAVAAYHAEGHSTSALHRALSADADEQRAEGVYDEATFASILNKLSWMMEHYVRVEPERLTLIERERELLIPIPSRTRRQRSNFYRLHAFLDGVHIDGYGRVWIVEFKLRGRLQSLQQITLNRQIRWYAWAWREHTGRAPAGVIVDERLNELPASVAFNKNGAVSKQQGCTEEAYVAACESREQEPDEDVRARLRAKSWQQRHRILLRPDELDEAGEQLTSAAKLTGLMDSGHLYPIRNPSPARCPGCPYKEICADPHGELLDALFHRRPPKRDRDWAAEYGGEAQMHLDAIFQSKEAA